MKENISNGVIIGLAGKKGQDDAFAGFLNNEKPATVAPNAHKLIKNQYKQLQSELDTAKAKLNPSVNPAAYEILRSLDGLNVLIVDDLFHTGSTLESVAIKVREAGAKSVTGFCLTKVNKGLN